MKKLVCVVSLVLLAGSGCAERAADIAATSEPKATSGPWNPDIDPANFSSSTKVDNTYFPLNPGTTYVYEVKEGDSHQDGTVTVTDKTKTIMGVKCVVVRDTVKEDGEVLEDTYDWYAQDDDGDVWYFGEDTTAYDKGKADTSGSWEAGKDGALPGILMKADPKVGDAYYQEYYRGEAEDQGEVLKLGQKITVKAGTYDDVLVTKDTTQLEPDLVEHKYYAPDVGFVYAKHVKGDPEVEQLVSVSEG